MAKKKEDKKKKTIVQTGTAAPGKTPNFRTTVQGDRFDINKPLVLSEFSSRESFNQASKIKGGGGFGGVTDVGELGQPGRGAVDIEARRRELFQKETGADVLQEELKQKIAEPPSLEPETQPFQEEVTELGLTPAATVGNFLTGLVEKVTGKTYGRTTPEELAKTDVGKFLGTATAATGIALVGALAAPYVVALVAKSAITKSVLGAGGSVPFLKTAIAGTTTFLVGRSILDIRGDEMDVLRQGLKKVVEDGERIEAAMRNGYPSEDTISLLTTMAEEVEYAEIRIKELGNNNIQYRVSKEYILDMQNVRSSREALLRRVLAVENIAATGQAAFNPEALMFNVAQFEKGGGE